MKKIVLIMLFVCFYSNAQDLTSFDNIGDDVQIIKGAIATIDTIEQIGLKKYGFEKLFYTDRDFINIYEPMVSQYLSQGKEIKLSITKYDNVAGMDFNVTDVVSMPQSGIYLIELKTPESKIIYYRYDSNLKDKQPLKIKSKLNFPKNITIQSKTEDTTLEIKEGKDYCSEVEISKDKFTGEISFNSPDIDNISFIKYKKKGVTNQYVSISIYDSYLSGYNNFGLTILFKNGKKIIRKNEKIDVNVSSGSDWRYSAFFTPNLNEINLLKNFEIEAVKLYIFNSDVLDGNSIKKFANCVLVTPKGVVKKKK